LVDDRGTVVLEAENTVQAGVTGHAELNLIQRAVADFHPDFLACCTIYASTEPCPMCSASICWGNVRRVVFGLSLASFLARVAWKPPVSMACRDLFACAGHEIQVSGPHLEERAWAVHEGFWQ
jgi:tRNA(Arg) A34 adenosine deaminase TadA